MADKIHNARSILADCGPFGEERWSRFKAGEGASVRWYYRELAAGFAARAEELGDGGRAALREYELVVEEIDRLAEQA